jgi:hypothetical protein
VNLFSSIGPFVQSRGPLYGLAAGWGVVLAVGLALQASYDARPGDEISAARHWPAASQLSRSANHPTLLIFVHPHCPCTSATLAELRQFLDTSRASADITIVLPQPQQASADFCDEPRARLEAAWPEAQVVVDRRGIETHLFQTTTSGHLLVYDPEGHLRFSGGITIARGHRGDNPGLKSLAAALVSCQEQTPTIATFPVFGCALLDAATEES